MKLITVIAWIAFLLCGTLSFNASAQDPFAAGVRATPWLSPEEEQKSFQLPPGFEIQLVASEPEIAKPLNMAFDAKGRLWITNTLEYPNPAPPGRTGRDSIKVLEDTNGDGKADKVTIFAEGLNIPSGIAVGHGGVWVANSPDLLFLQDTNGDGKADKWEVVVTGFGRRDTHELPNSFTWGPDGWLYGLNGVFNPAHVKYPPSSPHYRKDHPGFKFTCAMFRIHPKTREFQVFAEGTSNPWGITWDNQGSAFISACVIDHLWHITETGYYHRQGGPYPPHTWKSESIVKHTHQKAAYCGIDYFDSDAYPKKYRERLYMGNIHGGCINVDVLRRDGSTYFATPNPDFLTAHDAWFMPVVQKTGPDGCLYVLDWYDRYHCYQDANRDPKGIDRLKGRLYRVRYKNTPRVFGFNLAEETDSQLIDRLSSPNIYFRQTAQRILQERNSETARRTLQQIVLDDNTPQKTKLHALWSLLGSGELETGFHLKLLSNNDASLRAWGVRVAGDHGQISSVLKRRILELVHDSAPDVRLQLAIATGKIDSLSALPVWIEILSRSGDDKLIPHIVWQNLYPLLENQSDQFIQIVRDKRANSPALSAMMPRVLDRMLANRDGGMNSVVSLIEMLAAGANADVDAAGPCLSILASRIQSREISGEKLKTLKGGLQAVIGKILSQQPNAPLYSQAAFLATGWNDPAGIKAVRNVLVQPQQNPSERLAALDALVAAEDASLLSAVKTILSCTSSAALQ
ncbi:MAG: dehydrogenase [Planctomycetes bacterium]|nr:dehydrogenase [Planctomycetota bacterium]